MKKLILAVLASVMSCSVFGMEEAVDVEKGDYYEIVSHLLDINENRYSYVDSEGQLRPSELQAFKALETIYIRYIEPPDDGAGEYSDKQLKVIMLFAFYEINRNSGAFSEYLASDLMPVYLKSRPRFLKNMRELPFLIPPVCNRLNAYFGFENKNEAGKEKFVADIKAVLDSSFTKAQAISCLEQFGE